MMGTASLVSSAVSFRITHNLPAELPNFLAPPSGKSFQYKKKIQKYIQLQCSGRILFYAIE